MTSLVAFLALVACVEVGQESLDESFKLHVGETARVENAGIEIEFEQVVNDSRCPKDVTCIRAGEALVRLSVGSGGAHEPLQLKVPPAGSDSARYRDLVITIEALDPQTESGKRIDPSAYEATVRVSRA